MKNCSTCKEPKPNSHYRFKPGTKDGKDSQCRECRIASRRRAREKAKIVEVKPTGTNPWDWRNYKTQINWVDNSRYIPDTSGSKSFYI